MVFLKKIKDINWIELPLFRTNFRGPKGVRATEVRLYLYSLTFQWK